MDTLTIEVLSKDEELKKIHEKIEKLEDWEALPTNPLITVIVATYNHEGYIKECLDGILMQVTEYDYEIIIKEDLSTDKTREIILEYYVRHKDKIRLWLCKENLYSQKLKPVIPLFARGKYLAKCEGDDYWIDPFKLQKQVEFLEDNEEFAFTFHAVEVKNEVPGLNYSYPIPPKHILTFNNILQKHYIPTCSLLLRREYLTTSFPVFLKKCKMGDIPMELFMASKGRVYFFSEKMGVYRKNKGSITQTAAQKRKGRGAYIFVYKSLLIYLFPRYFFALSVKILKTSVGYIKDFIQKILK